MTLPAAVAAAMIAHARERAPEECCGLLIGDLESLVEAVPARNLADDPRRRYLIDPQDHFLAIRAARARALDVVGAYHSHPHSPAQPSATDRAEAFPGFLFIIVSLSGDRPVLAGFRLVDGNFVPVPLVRTP